MILYFKIYLFNLYYPLILPEQPITKYFICEGRKHFKNNYFKIHESVLFTKEVVSASVVFKYGAYVSQKCLGISKQVINKVIKLAS